MSKEAIQEFYGYVQSQPELQQELNALMNDKDAMVDKAIELGQQNNYSFTKEELEEVITNLEAAYAEGAELSDEQLEAVAGGKGGSVSGNAGYGSGGFNAGVSVGFNW